MLPGIILDISVQTNIKNGSRTSTKESKSGPLATKYMKLRIELSCLHIHSIFNLL